MTAKIFSDSIQRAVEYDWQALPQLPVEVAVLALQQGAKALDGAEDRIFHTRLAYFDAARKLEAWTWFVDPRVDQPFVNPREWVKFMFPNGTSYALKAWDRGETLKAVPLDQLKPISQANIDVLASDWISSGLRKDPEVLQAAAGKTQEGFKAYLTQERGQHIEPMRVMTKVDAERFERALEMVQVVDGCNRQEALIKAAELIEMEYLVAFEHSESKPA